MPIFAAADENCCHHIPFAKLRPAESLTAGGYSRSSFSFSALFFTFVQKQFLCKLHK